MSNGDSADTRIALLEQALRHIEDGMEDIKLQIRALPTRDQITQMVTQGQFEGLRIRVDSLEAKMKDEAVSTFWERFRNIGTTIIVASAAVAAVAAFTGWLKT